MGGIARVLMFIRVNIKNIVPAQQESKIIIQLIGRGQVCDQLRREGLISALSRSGKGIDRPVRRVTIGRMYILDSTEKCEIGIECKFLVLQVIL